MLKIRGNHGVIIPTEKTKPTDK